MVLSEQQKKDLVERLRAGREAKKSQTSKKEAPTPAPEPAPENAIAKPVPKPKRQPAKKAVEVLAPVEPEPTITTRDIPDSSSEDEPMEDEVVEEQPKKQIKMRPPTIKEKKLAKNKGYMAIKFYEKPDRELYQSIMSSIQPKTEPYYSNATITKDEREDTERRMKEIKEREEVEQIRIRDLIYRTIG
jgi:hypothetical protein